jgi:hypothetical protein
MKKYVFGLGALVAPSLVGAFLVAGCSEDNGGDGNGGLLGQGAEELCGPCGEIGRGDIGISGDARLDGFFKALGSIQNSTLTVRGDFEGNIRALAAVYDVDIEGAINADVVGELTAAIRTDIEANVQGGIKVDYQPPRCQANVNVAVQAQANCEAKAECTVNVEPGEVAVSCQGTCSGSCEGTCTGELSCEVQSPSIECSGSCEGSCTLEAGGTCNGTCRGECDGTCSVENTDGSCAGECTGECTGTCELTVAAECSGTCTGKCLVDSGSADCTAGASCRGSCSGECTGGCEGNFTPPSASANCDATARCEASARAEANASLECTPPQLKIDYQFGANVALNAQAQFTARLSELKVRGVAIVQGAAKYEALLTGKVEGRVVFDPAPVADLRARVQAFANIDAMGEFDMPAAKIPCAVTAFTQAGTMLGGMATQTAATLEAQAEFVTAFTTGFPEPS